MFVFFSSPLVGPMAYDTILKQQNLFCLYISVCVKTPVVSLRFFCLSCFLSRVSCSVLAGVSFFFFRPTAREALDHPWIQAGLSYSDEELWYPPEDGNGRGGDEAARQQPGDEEEENDDEDEVDEDVLGVVEGILEDDDDDDNDDDGQGSELMLSLPYRHSC